MREALIVASVRTAVGKAPRGTLKDTRPDDMAGLVIREAMARVPGLDPREIEDVILGCAMPEAEQGMNVARVAAFLAGLPPSVSAMTINRFCSSGLQSIALAADRIRTGSAEVMVAGGTETMSMIPMGGHKIVPNPTLVDVHPGVYLSMGLTAERLAKEFSITREQADQFSLDSHLKSVRAQDEGKFKNEIVPLRVKVVNVEARNGTMKRSVKEVVFDRDEGPRRDSSLEALAKLRPAFHVQGTVTAGNSSQMSDGAAAAILLSEDRARQLQAKPLARFVSFATAGVDPERMGIGPVEAIPKALKLAGLKLNDLDVIELNEAFATQSLAVIRAAGLDPSRVNVNGGAIALGHPLGCTGAKLTATLLNELERRRGRYGMVTMCVGGGMGAAGIFENLQR
ncbi:MAG: acetyl-CoA C-acyltransferase [Acidobacteriia bacterium]|nr:acetyl-CoA C-acyltransferase [Terriglobia bacterium]